MGCRSSPPSPSGGGASGSAYAGRPIAQTMSYLGADWLDRPDRVEREQPDRVLDALALDANSVVADVGAGSGFFTVRLATRARTVYATDLQPEMRAMLERRVAD